MYGYPRLQQSCTCVFCVHLETASSHFQRKSMLSKEKHGTVFARLVEKTHDFFSFHDGARKTTQNCLKIDTGRFLNFGPPCSGQWHVKVSQRSEPSSCSNVKGHMNSLQRTKYISPRRVGNARCGRPHAKTRKGTHCDVEEFHGCWKKFWANSSRRLRWFETCWC